MEKTLEYYYVDGSHVKFDKYIIYTTGIIRNEKSGVLVRTRKKGKYNCINVYDNDGKTCMIRICRAIASTFLGRPPTPEHTADHIDRDPNNDTLENIRWLCKSDQNYNQNRPETLKSSFIVIKGNIEKTVKEWVEHLKDQENHSKGIYTKSMIERYAQNNQHGFAYKKYPTLEGEMWKEITGSFTLKGNLEISNMNRVKIITRYAENVLSGERLCLDNGYPSIRVNGKKWYCHILSFATFFPEKYANKKPGELILHEDDDKLDFRPHKLHIGTQKQNTIDAHDNGKYDGTLSARQKCISCVEGVFEKEHDSQHDAMRFLKSNGYEKATVQNIGMVLNGKRKSAYGRTWKLST